MKFCVINWIKIEKLHLTEGKLLTYGGKSTHIVPE